MIFIFFLLIHSPFSALAGRTTPLFTIARSLNENIVHYDANWVSDSQLNEKEPVVAYWEMKTKGGKREELTGIEKRKAYGFTVKKTVDGFLLKLVPQPQRKIFLRVKGNSVTAETEIDKKPSQLLQLYIKTGGRGLIPKVEWIELFGKNLSSGEDTREKVMRP